MSVKTWLRKLRLKEISFVDKGANPGAKVVFMKRDDDSPPAAPAQTKVEKMTVEEILAGLEDEARAVMEAALAEAAAPKEEVAAAAPEAPEEMAKRDGLPEDVRKALIEAAKVKAEAAKDRERITKLEDAELFRKFNDEAADYLFLPNMTQDEIGSVLKSASALPAAEFEKVRKSLKAASDIVAKSGITKRIGREGGEPESAGERLESIAKKLREDDPKLSAAQAFTKAAKLNPDLYNEASKSAGGAQ